MFLFFLFYGVIIIFVIIRVRQRAEEDKKRRANRGQGQMAGQMQDAPMPRPQQAVSDDGQVHKKGLTGKRMSKREREVLVTKMMEDREHDWLAGQLAEEKRALRRMSEMFDIKISCSKSWDAEALKRFHAENCSAEGVDDPTVR